LRSSGVLYWIIALASGGRTMRTSISIALIGLIAISSIAFADDRKNQANVYDDFGQWWKPPPNVTVDEEVTSFIKRDMANLLYPVDMSSLSRPENDTKFRDLIIVLQQQMGASLRLPHFRSGLTTEISGRGGDPGQALTRTSGDRRSASIARRQMRMMRR
jgi:hypothetical protein